MIVVRWHHSDEAKAKISEARRGKPLTEAHRQRISEAKLGQIPWNKGKHHSQEVRQKISEAHTGKQITEEHRRKISEALMGKHLSEETKRKISETKQGKPHPCPWLMGDYNPSKRPEVRAKISGSLKGQSPSLETRQRMRESQKGRHHLEETRAKISIANKGKPHPWQVGENNPHWRGGISFEPYCPKFNREFKERVRAFWGYVCGNCGKPQEENRRKLHVHHVNYKKEACCEEDIPKYFIPLCDSCHGRTSHNREKWEKKLTKTLEKKFGGRCYFHQGEQLTAYGVL